MSPSVETLRDMINSMRTTLRLETDNENRQALNLLLRKLENELYSVERSLYQAAA